MKKQETKLSVIPNERIIKRIFWLRGKKVMFDVDLAEMYEVETGALKRNVNRNKERFPKDFMFELSVKEWEILRCQFVTSRWGGTRYLPYAFTEQGVAMLSSVLKSKRAIQVNIHIMRVFTELREMLLTHRDLREKIEKMEGKYDKQFRVVFEAIKQLIDEKTEPVKVIGFRGKK